MNILNEKQIDFLSWRTFKLTRQMEGNSTNLFVCLFVCSPPPPPFVMAVSVGSCDYWTWGQKNKNLFTPLNVGTPRVTVTDSAPRGVPSVHLNSATPKYRCKKLFLVMRIFWNFKFAGCRMFPWNMGDFIVNTTTYVGNYCVRITLVWKWKRNLQKAVFGVLLFMDQKHWQ